MYELIYAVNGGFTGACVTFEPATDDAMVYGVIVFADLQVTELNDETKALAELIGVAGRLVIQCVDEAFDTGVMATVRPEYADRTAVWHLEDRDLVVELWVNTARAEFWVTPAE